jgi:hypothetical protein
MSISPGQAGDKRGENSTKRRVSAGGRRPAYRLEAVRLGACNTTPSYPVFTPRFTSFFTLCFTSDFTPSFTLWFTHVWWWWCAGAWRHAGWDCAEHIRRDIWREYLQWRLLRAVRKPRGSIDGARSGGSRVCSSEWCCGGARRVDGGGSGGGGWAGAEPAEPAGGVGPRCEKRHHLFLSGFPMFVPSLSWQNDRFYS